MGDDSERTFTITLHRGSETEQASDAPASIDSSVGTLSLSS